jgi:hypothetical protein
MYYVVYELRRPPEVAWFTVYRLPIAPPLPFPHPPSKKAGITPFNLSFIKIELRNMKTTNINLHI